MSFLQETIDIELLQVEMFSIHGSVYYQIRYRTLPGEHTSPSEIHDMRINPEAFYSDPQEGDHVRVTRLLGNIMGAEKLDHAISSSD